MYALRNELRKNHDHRLTRNVLRFKALLGMCVFVIYFSLKEEKNEIGWELFRTHKNSEAYKALNEKLQK